MLRISFQTPIITYDCNDLTVDATLIPESHQHLTRKASCFCFGAGKPPPLQSKACMGLECPPLRGFALVRFVSGSVCVRLVVCVCVYVCLCVSVSVWLRGCVAVWLGGCVAAVSVWLGVCLGLVVGLV
jgi:hypothetical protein